MTVKEYGRLSSLPVAPYGVYGVQIQKGIQDKTKSCIFNHGASIAADAPVSVLYVLA
ncbi:hypothetical protein HMPREF3201_01581 [Megasphaera sp. MJR8396C]|nr:hypothetical protein HMPREF3201_01581 [Megasphaera sp. MJR8396C]